MIQLGPWHVPEEYAKDEDPPEVRFKEPHDGRVWGLDGTPKWLAAIHPCCSGDKRHYTWMVTVEPETVYGNAQTREAARAEVDTFLASWCKEPE